MDERRTGWLLIAVLLAQLALLAGQVPAPGEGGSRLAVLGLRSVAPFTRAVSGFSQAGRDIRAYFRRHRWLIDQNAILNRQVRDLRSELARLQGVQGELERLAEAVGYAQSAENDLRVARVVYFEPGSWLNSMVLYAGGEPLMANQPVLSSEGLVGRTVTPSGSYARVQLVTEPSASVGGRIERTGRQAIVEGTGGNLLELTHLSVLADVQVGDAVLTAGIDGVYPAGIRIGTVTEVGPGPDPLFHKVVLEPAVDLSRLDLVYLLAPQPMPDELKEPLSRALP